MRAAALGLILALACPGQAPQGPLVVSERWPQSTDLVSWTRDVMRIEELENASETEQAKAFFAWLRLFCRMAVGGMIQAYEGDRGQERYVLDAHKTLFVYGWGYCDTCSRIAEAAWKEYKRDAATAERVCVQHDNGGFHTMFRLRLDGRHAAFDPRYGYYAIERDGSDARILDWAEVGEDANLLRNRHFKHRSRPYFEVGGLEWERALLLKPVYFDSEEAWRKAGAPVESVFGNSQYRMGTRLHDMDFRLPKGTAIERFWDNSARKFYVPANPKALREWPFLPSGRFYRVTAVEDPKYRRAEPYFTAVPRDEGYDAGVAGGRTIGQAWGRITYAPDPADLLDALAPGATLVHARSAPYLRPRAPGQAGEAVLDFYSPYVVVDGTVEAELAGNARLELRSLQAKAVSAAEPDAWSAWRPVTGDLGLHGVYRFQLRVAASTGGLNALRLKLHFENGIMSLPQIFAGSNAMQFKLNNPQALRGPVRVTYRYRANGGRPAVHEAVLRPSDFHGGVAAYTIDAPGLERCDSVTVAY